MNACVAPGAAYSYNPNDIWQEFGGLEATMAPHLASVLDSLRRVVRAFRAAGQATERSLGISGAQHYVMERLAEGPAASLNELASRTMTHKSSVSVVVSRLVERGFVQRTASDSDGRRRLLALTPAGRRALSRAPGSAQTRMIQALARLPDDDLARFAGMFARVTAELGAHRLTPTMMFENDGVAVPRSRRRPIRTRRRNK